MNQAVNIRGGHIVDPVSGRDEIGDVFVENGLIVENFSSSAHSVDVFDATGLTVLPGFIDLHVHLREPGNEEAETIATGSRAAARGGFTCIVAMPNTTPAADTAERVQALLAAADEAGMATVLPTACITRSRAGHELADLPSLARAGAVAFTDDGASVPDPDLMEQAMRVAARLNLPVMDHALDDALAGHGVMHAGPRAAQLGLPGIPSDAEVVIVQRDIDLCRQTGCRVHIQHVSARESVALIRRARAEGLALTAEATPHHLFLADEDIPGDDADYKMNPPLGSVEDRDALMAGVIDGAIQALATDHAPHTRSAKAKGFLAAPFGIVGLETAVGITYTLLVKAGRLSLSEWVRRWTAGPAAVLGIPAPSLQPGVDANITVLDLAADVKIQRSSFVSKSINTPFEGRRVTGEPAATFCRGLKTWDRRS